MERNSKDIVANMAVARVKAHAAPKTTAMAGAQGPCVNMKFGRARCICDWRPPQACTIR